MKEEIDQKYIEQANTLEAEFFDIILELKDGKVIGQHRELKPDKSLDEFNTLHGEIWHNHELELIENGFINTTPTETPPPHSTHISVLVSVNPSVARPAQVKRLWEGREYFYNCFVTQTIRDEFAAGKILVGDYVAVHFDERGEQLVMGKVFKSW